MRGLLGVYVAIIVPLCALDFVWLKVMSSRLYQPTLGDILSPQPALLPAALFYLLYPVALAAFVVYPAFQREDVSYALIMGAAFGIAAHGTYALTNHAVLRNWTAVLTMADIGWGAFLAAVCCTTGYLVARKLLVSVS